MSASVISTESITGVASIVSSLKELSHSDLLKVMKSLTTELGKKSKDMAKEVTAAKKEQKKAKKEKAGPKEKKSLPKHLRKPHAWVAYTLQNALENGWSEFVINQRKKNKETGEVEEEEIVMPAGVLNSEGAWVYESSIGSEKNPNGKQINHKEAMSLSKVLKDSGDKSWTAFEAQYFEEEGDDSDTKSVAASETSKKSTVVRKTAAEKEAEKEAAKAAKDAEKAAAKAAKTAKEVEKATVKSPAAKKVEEPKVEEKKVVIKKVVSKK